MQDEKEFLFSTLRMRGVLKADNSIDRVRFNKLVTETHLRQLCNKYDIFGLNTSKTVDVPVEESKPVEQAVETEAVIVEESKPVEQEAETEAIKKTTKKQTKKK